MFDQLTKPIAILLVVPLALAAGSTHADDYSVKIPAANVVNALAAPAQNPSANGRLLPSVQAVETSSASAAAPSQDLTQLSKASSSTRGNPSFEQPGIEGGPTFVGPAISPANPAIDATFLSSATVVEQPTMVTGPVVLENGATFIYDGCPTCACVVCECPRCAPMTPIGSVCGASNCCPNWWFRKDMFAWVVKGDNAPPLVTTSPNGWPAADAGVLGQPDTRSLFGEERLKEGLRFGGRLVGGFWFDPCRKRGLQLDLWGIAKIDEDYRVESDGDPVLARPFYNTDIGAPDAQIVAYPGLAQGSISVHADGKMVSAAPLWRFNMRCRKKCRFGKEVNHRFDFLVGYRYWHLDEDLAITERLEPIGGFYAPGTALKLTDAIETQNDFHGAEFGVEWLRQCGKWVCELNGTIASGRIYQQIQGTGTTLASVPGVPERTVDGGFYVPAGGIDARDDRGTIIPQARIGLGYYFRPRIRVHANYDFVYVSNVLRPSGALHSAFPGSRLASGGVPGDGFAGYEETDIWMQGLSFGATMNF